MKKGISFILVFELFGSYFGSLNGKKVTKYFFLTQKAIGE